MTHKCVLYILSIDYAKIIIFKVGGIGIHIDMDDIKIY